MVQIGAENPYKVPANYMMADPTDPSKGLIPIPGGPATKPTQAQSAAAGYANRMVEAQSTIQRLTKQGFDPVSLIEQGRGLFNITASKELQKYRQAQKDWVRAKLRDESGAVIGEEEMQSEIETYLDRLWRKGFFIEWDPGAGYSHDRTRN